MREPCLYNNWSLFHFFENLQGIKEMNTLVFWGGVGGDESPRGGGRVGVVGWGGVGGEGSCIYGKIGLKFGTLLYPDYHFL